MNLSTEIIGVVLLALLFCVTLLIRYVLVGRTLMRNTQARLIKVEEEVHNHPLNCPLMKQKEDKKQATALPPARVFSLAGYFQTRLLTSAEAARFRNAFTAAYPDILPRLRTICPEVTRADEMLCILIILKQTNEEISYLLGISRSSVLKNRYRLRLKLELPEDAELDPEVRRMLSNEAEQPPRLE